LLLQAYALTKAVTSNYQQLHRAGRVERVEVLERFDEWRYLFRDTYDFPVAGPVSYCVYSHTETTGPDEYTVVEWSIDPPPARTTAAGAEKPATVAKHVRVFHIKQEVCQCGMRDIFVQCYCLSTIIHRVRDAYRVDLRG
jgi:hypothetical protein